MDDNLRIRTGVPLVQTSDPREMTEQVGRLVWRHSVTPQLPGRFTASVRELRTADLSMLWMDYGGMPVRVRATAPPDHIVVCLPEHDAVTVQHHGTRARIDADSGFVVDAGAESVTDWDGALRLLVLRIATRCLRRQADRMLSGDVAELDRLRFGAVLDAATSAVVRRQAHLLADLVGAADGRPGNPVAVTMVREHLLTSLLLGADSSWRDRLRTRSPRSTAARSPVHTAVELMVAGLGEPLTIDGIARDVGLSPRALHAGFHREYGCSPKQYLTRLRLESAHRDLSTPGTGLRVLDVAHRWGFPHPGRFAGAYQQYYGELPGETRAVDPEVSRGTGTG